MNRNEELESIGDNLLMVFPLINRKLMRSSDSYPWKRPPVLQC